MVFQVVVPSVELEKLAYREESDATAWMWADVQFITPPLPALFVKFVSARFPVLQTITRNCMFLADSFLFMRFGTIASHSRCSDLSINVFMQMNCVCFNVLNGKKWICESVNI